jgi:hypothetical protein
MKNEFRTEKILIFFTYLLLFLLFLFLTNEGINDFNNDTRDYLSFADDAIEGRVSSLCSEIKDSLQEAGRATLFLSGLIKFDADNNFSFKKEDFSKLYDQFNDFLTKNSSYESITLIGLDGKEIMKVSSSQGGVNFITLSSGNSYKDKDYLINTVKLKANEVYTSNIEKDSGSSLMYYATPVFDQQKRMAGVIVLTVNVDSFIDDVRDFSREGEEVFLIDDSGIYLANQDKEKEFSGAYNFKDDFGEPATQILSDSGQRRIETNNNIFIFKYIRPTLSTFQISQAAETIDSDYDFYWVLVSVSSRDGDRVILSGIKSHRLLCLIVATMVLALLGLLVNFLYARLINSKARG